MISKGLAFIAGLFVFFCLQLPAVAQSNSPSGAGQAAGTPSAPPQAATGSAAGSSARPDCQSGPCDDQPPHITIATPAPAPAPWPLQDRIAWGAKILLALLGYAGIMLALTVLKKIERQGKYFEMAATAAAESAQSARLQAQFIRHAERPWVLVTVEASPSVANGFNVVATNRGRSPARLVGIANELKIAPSETKLPGIPEFSPADPELPPVAIILLPGEMTSIKSFCRDDVAKVSGSEAALQRIENWEERIFLYGKITYKDLMAPPDEASRETGWCCRYIHGRQKSGMVMAGTQEYNAHT
jgi:hypothetical protein